MQSWKKNNRLKLLSFSPDDSFGQINYKPHQTHRLQKGQKRLYEIYKHDSGKIKNRQNQRHSKFENSSRSNSIIFNPQKVNKNSKLDLLDNYQNALLPSSQNNNKKFCSIVVNSADKIKQNLTFRSFTSNQGINKNYKSTHHKTFFISPLSSYKEYLKEKHSYKKNLKSRAQNEKDLHILTNTLRSTKIQEQKIKKDLIKTLNKRIQKEQKQRQKQLLRQKQNQWLQRQKNENHTKKYMNHLMKYHAKKSLLENNSLAAQEIRQRSISASSIRSLRSSLSSHRNFERSRVQRQKLKENVKRAQEEKYLRKIEQSHEVNLGKAKVFESESSYQQFRIGELNERKRVLLGTIQSSRRNNEMLKDILGDIKGRKEKRMSSRQTISQLNQTLYTIRARSTKDVVYKNNKITDINLNN